MSKVLPFSLRPAAVALAVALSSGSVSAGLTESNGGLQMDSAGDESKVISTLETQGSPAISLTYSATSPTVGEQKLTLTGDTISISAATDMTGVDPSLSPIPHGINVDYHKADSTIVDSQWLALSATGDVSISSAVNHAGDALTHNAAIHTEHGRGNVAVSGKTVTLTATNDGRPTAIGINNAGAGTVTVTATAGDLTVKAEGPNEAYGTNNLAPDPTADGNLTVLKAAAGAVNVSANAEYAVGIYTDAKNRTEISADKVNVTVTSVADTEWMAYALQNHHATGTDTDHPGLLVNAASGLTLIAKDQAGNAGVAIENLAFDNPAESTMTVISQGTDNTIFGNIENGGILKLVLPKATFTGDIINTFSGTTDVTLNGGTYEGQITNTSDTGTVNMTVKDVDWKATGNSDVTNLKTQNTTYSFKTPDGEYAGLTVGHFEGDNNTFVLRADLDAEAAGDPKLDTIEIKNGSGTSTNKVKVVVTNNTTDDAKAHTVNPGIVNGAAGLTLNIETEGGYVDGTTDRWVMRYAENADALDADDAADTLPSEGAGGAWYLVRLRNQTNTAEGNMVQTLGTGLSGYLSYRNELAMLGDRLGSVRQTGDAGLWVRVSGDKAHAKGASGLNFKQTDVSVTLGADGKVWEGGNRTVIAGGAFKAGRSNLDGAAAKADVNHYSLKGYATMMNANGAYVDAVLQTGVYTHDMKGRSNTGLQSVTGDYNTFGFGASLEAGHRFGFAKNFFAEPSMQLSWFHLKGRDYTLSTGMNAAAGSADFLTGRLGVTAGWEKTSGTANTESFSRQALALRTGVNRDFRAKQNVVTGDVTEKLNARGTSVYYGLEGTWTLGNTSLFAVVDREEGNKYRRDFGVKAGVRVQF